MIFSIQIQFCDLCCAPLRGKALITTPLTQRPTRRPLWAVKGAHARRGRLTFVGRHPHDPHRLTLHQGQAGATQGASHRSLAYEGHKARVDTSFLQNAHAHTSSRVSDQRGEEEVSWVSHSASVARSWKRGCGMASNCSILTRYVRNDVLGLDLCVRWFASRASAFRGPTL
jgi:hypothetical protein